MHNPMTMLMFSCGLASALVGCDMPRNCTMMYVSDGLEIGFDPAPSAAGTWTLELSGGYSSVCEVELPVPDPSNMSYTPCGEDPHADLKISDDGTGITSLVLVDAVPESVQLDISFAGELVWGGSLTPTYETSEPNGKGCGESVSGEVTVVVPAP